MIVPRDTMALRPQLYAVNGMIRYNTNTSKFEAYEAGAWVNVVSSASPGAEARFSAEASS